MELAAGWVWETRVRALLELLGRYVGYDFDGTDWQAVSAGLEPTDDELPDGWFRFPLPGSARLDVSLARSIGSAVVTVCISGPDDPELRLRAETLLTSYAHSR